MDLLARAALGAPADLESVTDHFVATMIEPPGDALLRPDFWVADADAAAAEAERRGGSVVQAPQGSPVGKSAVLADPAGAVFSISQLEMP